jgi:hypothetical protein
VGGDAVKVRVKYSEDQERDDHGRFGSGGGASHGGAAIYYEVAPDPNNAALTARWNSLTDNEKVEVSGRIAEDIAPQVLDAAGLVGEQHLQYGGYQGATNPSFVIDTSSDAADRLLPAANLLGHTLSQDSMMVVSDKAFATADPTGVITVHLPKASSLSEVTKTYDTLWKLEESGEKLVGGHSTYNGQMNILNFSSLSNEEFANRIDQQLGGAHKVEVRSAFVAFPQKADYGNNLPPGYSIPSGQSTGSGRADRLRGEASKRLEQELVRLGKAASGQAWRKVQPRPGA